MAVPFKRVEMSDRAPCQRQAWVAREILHTLVRTVEMP